VRLLWLAEDCRAAGLKVVELPGWQARGAEFPTRPDTVVCHHTATPKAAKGDLPTQKILVEGRHPDNPDAPDHLPGPLCQVGLGRNGTVYVVASGKANHAGKGAWKGTSRSERTIGIEAEHPGVGDWPAKQYDAYVRLVAVLVRGLGTTFEHICGHKEWALPKGRKTDPTFDMAAFRSRVHAQLLPHAPSTKEWDEMASKEEIKAALREVNEELFAKLHAEHVLILHGDKGHPVSLDSIASAMKVPGAPA
jgi:hypothetical protein